MTSYRPLQKQISLSFYKSSTKSYYYLELICFRGVRVVVYTLKLGFLYYQYRLYLLRLAVLIYSRTTYNVTFYNIRSIIQPLTLPSIILCSRTSKISRILSLHTQIYSSRRIYRPFSVYISSIVISSSNTSSNLVALATYTVSFRSSLPYLLISLQMPHRLYLQDTRRNILQPRIQISYSSLMTITRRRLF